jgi:hypothetical protein
LGIPLTDPSALKNAVPIGRPINPELEEFYDNSVLNELINDGFVQQLSKAYS